MNSIEISEILEKETQCQKCKGDLQRQMMCLYCTYLDDEPEEDNNEQ